MIPRWWRTERIAILLCRLVDFQQTIGSQESPSQTILLTPDFIDILVNCLESLYHPCKICLPLFTYIYHEHKANAGTYFMHLMGYSSTASDVCLVWIGFVCKIHRWGLDNTWRIVYWPYHACRCVMNSTGGPAKTPSVTWFWGDFFMCFRRAGILPSGGDCKGIHRESRRKCTHLFQSLGRM